MRILIVHRYYRPDTAPCGRIMACIAEHLSIDGHCVHVLTSQPSYRSSGMALRQPHFENVGGVNIRRIFLPTEAGRPVIRIINALHLGLFTLLKAVTGQFDAIIVGTVPPVLGPLFAAVAAKVTGARLVYYCMDLHPEAGQASGDFAKPLLFSLLRGLDDWTCRRARPMLVHSVDMKNTMLSRPRGAEYTIDIMNNFSVPADHTVLENEVSGRPACVGGLKLIYAGNVGRFQGLESIVDAMGLIADRKDIEMVIMGDGVMKDRLIASQKRTGANVSFVGHQPLEVAKRMMRDADLGVVTLAPGMYRYAYPSKVMTYLEQGLPIIAAVEVESELVVEMNNGGYGVSVPAGAIGGLAELLLRLADDKRWKSKMSEAAILAFRRSFSAERVLSQWSDLFKVKRV